MEEVWSGEVEVTVDRSKPISCVIRSVRLSE
jgi:hypothetical protein